MTRHRNGAPVVVVGGGVAGVSAAATLRAEGYEGQLVLVSAECALPYRRSPLSKAYLRGEIGRDELAIEPPDFYRRNGIDLVLGARAVALDPLAHSVVLRGHGGLRYSRLIVATGARQHGVPDREGVYTLGDVAQAEALRDAAGRSGRAVVAGMGPTGSEAAASLRSLGVDVVALEEERLPSAAFGDGPGEWLGALHRRNGVELRTGEGLLELLGAPKVEAVRTTTGAVIETDLVVLAVGTEPDTDLAASGGLALADGVLADEWGATSSLGIFAAGDVARLLYPPAAALIRFGTEMMARTSGAISAKAALGVEQPEWPLASFTTEQYGVRLDVLGLPGPGNDVVETSATAEHDVWAYRPTATASADSGGDRLLSLALPSRP